MIISLASFFIFIFSIMVITSYSPVTSVVFLIATFVSTAIYLSSINLIYIALTYVIVYVGAVITLFLFVVIMINLGNELSNTPFTQTIPLTIVIVTLFTVLVVSSNTSSYDHEIFQTLSQMIIPSDLSPGISTPWAEGQFLITSAAPQFNHWNQIQSIAFELYTHQAMWLVLVSMVLIISMIGPIVICRSEKR